MSAACAFRPATSYPVRMGAAKQGHSEGECKTLKGGKVPWRVRVKSPDSSASQPPGMIKG